MGPAIRDPSPEVDLDILRKGMPMLTKAMGKRYATAAVFCLERTGHVSGVTLITQGDFNIPYRVQWSKIDAQIERDDNATEWAAAGLAIMVVRAQTGKVVQNQAMSEDGTIEYWLGEPNDDEPFGFQSMIRLRVSGVWRADDSDIASEALTKLTAMRDPEHRKLRAYVVIVEFGRPTARVVSQ